MAIWPGRVPARWRCGRSSSSCSAAPAPRRSRIGGDRAVDRLDDRQIAHVADGDTVDLTNGQKVRLVQIDTPEVYFTSECYGEQASAITKRLLPPGTRVTLDREPATDSVDRYGRLLRYVVRAQDGLNVNVQLVRVGAAPRTSTTPTGALRRLLERLALHAGVRARSLGPLSPHPLRPESPRRSAQPLESTGDDRTRTGAVSLGGGGGGGGGGGLPHDQMEYFRRDSNPLLLSAYARRSRPAGPGRARRHPFDHEGREKLRRQGSNLRFAINSRASYRSTTPERALPRHRQAWFDGREDANGRRRSRARPGGSRTTDCEDR